MDQHNLSKTESKAFEKDKRFLLPLYTYFILDYLTYFWCIYQFTYADFRGLFERIALIIASSHLAAVNMVVGHELLHRRQLVHKIFGTLTYTKALYSHFFIEHVKGHHKNVATPVDPACSRINETLYQFFPKTFFGSYKSVWKYEVDRLQKKKVGKLAALLQNRLITFNIAHVAWVALIAYFFGIKGLIFVLTYAFLTVFYLETINYIEHYGLERKQDENGVYEPVNIKHSWNAPHRYTNYILFKLQRHSDHHANSYKPYQILNSYADSPTLLGGYSVALITSFCPPVWFKAYNPLAKAAMEEREVTPEQRRA
jgi:alkane 1-monooxygenase